MKHSRSFPESKGQETEMDRYWDKLRGRSYDDTFEKTTGLLLSKQNLKKERKLSPMKNFISEHKYKLAIALFLAFLVAACNYPVSQENTVGYGVTFTAVSTGADAVAQNISAIKWPGTSTINSNTNSVNGKNVTDYNIVLQGADEQSVMRCKSDLEKIKEVGSIKIFPLTENVKRPVYSALLYNFFRIDVKSSGKTNEEVVREIEQQLKDNGFTNYKVGYENSGGINKLTIKTDGTQENKNGSVEVRVSGDGKEEVVKMKTVVKGSEHDKKLTDDEIKQKVIQDNPEGNLKPEDIKIEREGDKVRVKVEKEDVKK